MQQVLGCTVLLILFIFSENFAMNVKSTSAMTTQLNFALYPCMPPERLGTCCAPCCHLMQSQAAMMIRRGINFPVLDLAVLPPYVVHATAVLTAVPCYAVSMAVGTFRSLQCFECNSRIAPLLFASVIGCMQCWEDVTQGHIAGGLCMNPTPLIANCVVMQQDYE